MADNDSRRANGWHWLGRRNRTPRRGGPAPRLWIQAVPQSFGLGRRFPQQREPVARAPLSRGSPEMQRTFRDTPAPPGQLARAHTTLDSNPLDFEPRAIAG